MGKESVIFTRRDTGQGDLRVLQDLPMNGNRTHFLPGERCFLKIYPGLINHETTMNTGEVLERKNGLSEEHTEYLVFHESDHAKTEYPPVKILEASWEGKDCGEFRNSGSTFSLSEKKSGILRVRYATTFDRYCISAQAHTLILFQVFAKSETSYTTIDYTEETDSDLRQVTLNVRDACTGEDVEGANVYLNDKFAGVSRVDGTLPLGLIRRGTYSLRITKEGYADSDSDNIRNDSFTVE
ncbi:carboxypeptidase-like regulatory domain-containing protein [Limisalsivibrio acetivorans]|uniref:carboxypeptidase-like regulatory domain-containing protein n=1 Tax=Limisalsivibrio acetivorans TaxID=1304888 RepID=UPI0003B5FF9B|nr:carboxypeptidase-like regulatory domain-containing protein [Limisalsivibrio acetivorans]